MQIPIPTKEEFIKGVDEFEKHEKRDAMYKVATFLVSHYWGKCSDMADGLGVLLLTWNQVFYRYGLFDFDKLEICLEKNFPKIIKFKNKDILALSNSDEEDIIDLFYEFLLVLQRIDGTQSPVSVSKALHLLVPSFFPLWDYKIAKAYKCYYGKEPAKKYVNFCKIIKAIAVKTKNYVDKPEKTLIKLIDEYNYSKYTKEWL